MTEFIKLDIWKSKYNTIVTQEKKKLEKKLKILKEKTTYIEEKKENRVSIS